MCKYLILIGFVFACKVVVAQSDSTENQGEVVSGEIVIEKNKKITLPKSDKIYQRGDLLKLDSEKISINLTSFEPKLEWPSYNSDIPFINVKSDYPLNEYPNYLKLGYGNYGSPLVELGIKEWVGSFDLRNRIYFESFSSGPISDENSANSIANFDFSAKYAASKIEIIPYIGYSSNHYKFYGNTDRLNTGFSDAELPRIAWSNFMIGTMLKGTSKKVRYSVKPQFGSTSQKPEDSEASNKENVVSALGSLSIGVDEYISTGIHLKGYSANYKSGIDYTRSLLQANPWLLYKKENYSVKAGIKVASNKSDTIDQSGIYPDINGELLLNPKWKVSAHLNGGIDWQNFNELMGSNEFLDDSLQILNTETKISVGGGLNGKLLSNLRLDVRVSFADLANIPFFIPSPTDSSKYTITYDEGIQRIRLSSTLEFIPSRNALYATTFEVNSYSLDNLERPWHLPLYVIKFHSSHTVKEKLIFSTAVQVMGGIKAPTLVDFGIEELNPSVDLSIDIHYKVTDRVSAFVMTRNLLNNEYQRYLGYPVRGATFKLGGQYRF